MSTDVTMKELELETAELLPSRETLCVCYFHKSPSFSQTAVGGSYNGNGSGNGILNIGNGTLDGNAINVVL